MLIEYAKTRDDVKTPTRSNPSDAGMDLYYCPEAPEVVMIPPLGKAVLETGLKFAIPHGFAMEIKNRSGTSSKKGLVVGACLIDPGYEGEIKIGLHNISQVPQTIEPGDKLAQFVIYPVVHVGLRERKEEELFEEHMVMSNRADGGFGSTDG